MSEAPERLVLELRQGMTFDAWTECRDPRYAKSEPVEYVRADRIEELEAKGLANKVAIMRLEAKLAKALEFIQDLTGCEWPYDEDAKRILAELTGGKDD